MIFESLITCPQCGTAKAETMPTDACQFFYECVGGGTTLRPKPGDCCVFCSYGSVPCPPIQAERSGETGAASCCAQSAIKVHATGYATRAPAALGKRRASPERKQSKEESFQGETIGE
jgi:hypothetical protein